MTKKIFILLSPFFLSFTMDRPSRTTLDALLQVQKVKETKSGLEKYSLRYAKNNIGLEKEHIVLILSCSSMAMEKRIDTSKLKNLTIKKGGFSLKPSVFFDFNTKETGGGAVFGFSW